MPLQFWKGWSFVQGGVNVRKMTGRPFFWKIWSVNLELRVVNCELRATNIGCLLRSCIRMEDWTSPNVTWVWARVVLLNRRQSVSMFGVDSLSRRPIKPFLKDDNYFWKTVTPFAVRWTFQLIACSPIFYSWEVEASGWANYFSLPGWPKYVKVRDHVVLN